MLKTAMRSLHSLLQAEQTKCPQPLLIKLLSLPHGPALDPLKLNVFFILGAQNCPQDWRLPQHRAQQDTPLPGLAGNAGPDAPQDMIGPPGYQGTAGSYPTYHPPGPLGPFPQLPPPSSSLVHTHNQGCPVPGAESSARPC